MTITQPSADMESQPKQAKRRSRQFIRAIQALSRIITLIFLLSLTWAIYQAVFIGNPLTLWSWLGLAVLFAAAIGIVVAAVVYRGVVDQVGPFSLRPSSRVAGKLKSESQRVEAGGASSLRAELKLMEGILQLAGGAADVMEANFTYDDADWKPPFVQYRLDPSGQGFLEVEQQATHRPAMRQGRCEWVVRLNDDLPVDLKVKFGAGKAELKLAGLALIGLRVESGVGELVVDLSGEWQHSLAAFIKAGIGDTILRLPKDTGVCIETEVSLGSTYARDLIREGEAYVNAAFGKSLETLDIRVESGMGKLTLE